MFSFFTQRNFEQKLGIFFLVFAFLLALIQASSAHSYTVGSLDIGHPWSRETPAGIKVGGGYLTVKNSAKNSDRLLAVTSDIAKRIEIHEMAIQDGIMKMRKLENGLDIPAQGEVTLKPGSYHLMLLDLSQPLKEGESFKATLQFEKAGSVEVSFKIEAMGNVSHESHDHHNKKHDTHAGHGNH